MTTGIDVVDAEIYSIMHTVDLNMAGGSLPVFFECWRFVIQINRERDFDGMLPGFIYRVLVYHVDALNDPAPRMLHGSSLEALLDRVMPQMFMGVMP